MDSISPESIERSSVKAENEEGKSSMESNAQSNIANANMTVNVETANSLDTCNTGNEIISPSPTKKSGKVTEPKYPGLNFILFVKSAPGQPTETWFECILCAPSKKMIPKEMTIHLRSYSHLHKLLTLECPGSLEKYSDDTESNKTLMLRDILEFEALEGHQSMVAANPQNVDERRLETVAKLQDKHVADSAEFPKMNNMSTDLVTDIKMEPEEDIEAGTKPFEKINKDSDKDAQMNAIQIKIERGEARTSALLPPSFILHKRRQEELRMQEKLQQEEEHRQKEEDRKQQQLEREEQLKRDEELRKEEEIKQLASLHKDWPKEDTALDMTNYDIFQMGHQGKIILMNTLDNLRRKGNNMLRVNEEYPYYSFLHKNLATYNHNEPSSPDVTEEEGALLHEQFEYMTMPDNVLSFLQKPIVPTRYTKSLFEMYHADLKHPNITALWEIVSKEYHLFSDAKNVCTMVESSCQSCDPTLIDLQDAYSSKVLETYNEWPSRREMNHIQFNDVTNLSYNRKQNNIVIICDERDIALTTRLNIAQVQVKMCHGLTLENAYDFISSDPDFDKGALYVVLAGSFSFVQWQLDEECQSRRCMQPLILPSVENCLESDLFERIRHSARNLRQAILMNTKNDEVIFGHVLPIGLRNNSVYLANVHSKMFGHESTNPLYTNINKHMYVTLNVSIVGYNAWVDQCSEALSLPVWNVSEGFYFKNQGANKEFMKFNLKQLTEDGISFTHASSIMRCSLIENLCKKTLEALKNKQHLRSIPEYFSISSPILKGNRGSPHKFDRVLLFCEPESKRLLDQFATPQVLISDGAINQKFITELRDQYNLSNCNSLWIFLSSIKPIASKKPHPLCRQKKCDNILSYIDVRRDLLVHSSKQVEGVREIMSNVEKLIEVTEEIVGPKCLAIVAPILPATVVNSLPNRHAESHYLCNQVPQAFCTDLYSILYLLPLYDVLRAMSIDMAKRMFIKHGIYSQPLEEYAPRFRSIFRKLDPKQKCYSFLHIDYEQMLKQIIYMAITGYPKCHPDLKVTYPARITSLRTIKLVNNSKYQQVVFIGPESYRDIVDGMNSQFVSLLIVKMDNTDEELKQVVLKMRRYEGNVLWIYVADHTIIAEKANIPSSCRMIGCTQVSQCLKLKNSLESSSEYRGFPPGSMVEQCANKAFVQLTKIRLGISDSSSLIIAPICPIQGLFVGTDENLNHSLAHTMPAISKFMEHLDGSIQDWQVTSIALDRFWDFIMDLFTQDIGPPYRKILNYMVEYRNSVQIINRVVKKTDHFAYYEWLKNLVIFIDLNLDMTSGSPPPPLAPPPLPPPPMLMGAMSTMGAHSNISQQFGAGSTNYPPGAPGTPSPFMTNGTMQATPKFPPGKATFHPTVRPPQSVILSSFRPPTGPPPSFVNPQSSMRPSPPTIYQQVAASVINTGGAAKKISQPAVPKPVEEKEFRVFIGKIPLIVTDFDMNLILNIIGDLVSFERPKTVNASLGVAKFTTKESAERCVRLLDNFLIKDGMLEVRVLYFSDKKPGEEKLGMSVQLKDKDILESIQEIIKKLGIEMAFPESTKKKDAPTAAVVAPEVKSIKEASTISNDKTSSKLPVSESKDNDSIKDAATKPSKDLEKAAKKTDKRKSRSRSKSRSRNREQSTKRRRYRYSRSRSSSSCSRSRSRSRSYSRSRSRSYSKDRSRVRERWDYSRGRARYFRGSSYHDGRSRDGNFRNYHHNNFNGRPNFHHRDDFYNNRGRFDHYNRGRGDYHNRGRDDYNRDYRPRRNTYESEPDHSKSSSQRPKTPPMERSEVSKERFSPVSSEREATPPKKMVEVKISNLPLLANKKFVDDLVMAVGAPEPTVSHRVYLIAQFSSLKRAVMVAQQLNDFRVVDKVLKVEVLEDTKAMTEEISIVEDTAIAKEIENVYNEYRDMFITKLQEEVMKEPDIFTFRIFRCAVPKCREYDCHYYHHSYDRRRDFVEYKYCEKMCHYARQNQPCPKGEWCVNCHSQIERMYHPKNYKANVCLDWYELKKCPKKSFCPKAHPLSTDSFFTEAWKDMFIAGLDQTFLYFAGAIKMLYRIGDNEGGVPIILITTLKNTAQLIHEVTQPISKIHRLKISVITENLQDPAGAHILIGTPSGIAKLIEVKGSTPLGGLRLLILDEATTLINNPYHQNHLNYVIDSIYKEISDKSKLCKVATSETCHSSEIACAEDLFGAKLSLFNPHKLDRNVLPSKVKVMPHKAIRPKSISPPRPKKVSSKAKSPMSDWEDSDEGKKSKSGGKKYRSPVSKKKKSPTPKKTKRRRARSSSSNRSKSSSSSRSSRSSSRSVSRSSSKSSSRSRSRDHKKKRKESSEGYNFTADMMQKLNLREEGLRKEHEAAYSVYLEVPEMHPQYESKYERFLKSYKKKYNTTEESEHLDRMWQKYWKVSIESLKTKEWKRKRKELLETYRDEAKEVNMQRSVSNTSNSDTPTRVSRTEPPAMSSAAILSAITAISSEPLDSFNVPEALNMLEKLSDKLGKIEENLIDLIKGIRSYGVDSQAGMDLLKLDDNIEILNSVFERLIAQSQNLIGDESEVYRKTIAWGLHLIKHAKKFKVPTVDKKEKAAVKFDLNLFSRQTFNKDPAWIYKTLEQSLEYVYKSKPSEDLVKQMYANVMAVHNNMANSTPYMLGSGATPARPQNSGVMERPEPVPIQKFSTIPLTPLIPDGANYSHEPKFSQSNIQAAPDNVGTATYSQTSIGAVNSYQSPHPPPPQIISYPQNKEYASHSSMSDQNNLQGSMSDSVSSYRYQSNPQMMEHSHAMANSYTGSQSDDHYGQNYANTNNSVDEIMSMAKQNI